MAENTITFTDDERSEAESMLYELWMHRQEGHGSWYLKRWLFSLYSDDPDKQAAHHAIELSAFDKLVKGGQIEICPTDGERVALGDSANVGLSITF